MHLILKYEIILDEEEYRVSLTEQVGDTLSVENSKIV